MALQIRILTKVDDIKNFGTPVLRNARKQLTICAGGNTNNGSQMCAVMFDEPQDINTVIPVSPNAGAVVVNLGTNDINYWMQNKLGVNPNVAAFTSAYVALLQQIRALNPNAAIIATIGPTLGDYQCISGSTAAEPRP